MAFNRFKNEGTNPANDRKEEQVESNLGPREVGVLSKVASGIK